MIIPAAEQMGLREGPSGVTIPLATSVNDKGYLFAGSIFSGATLAAYRCTERLFEARGMRGELVSKTATITYLRRILSDGLAIATPAGEPLLKPNGNYTVTQTVQVLDQDGLSCAELTAEFILVKACL